MAVDKRKVFTALNYKPHSRQWLFHDSPARFRTPVCGRRYGKSTMSGMDAVPEMLNGWQTRGWICGPTYDLGEKEFRVMWDALIRKAGLGKDKRVKKAYNKKSGDMYIELPWQARVEVRSADHPASLVGEALNWVIMSEAAKHKSDTFERYIRPALADFRGWATFPTTPEGYNWLYDIWAIGQNPAEKDYESWRYPSWENPYVYPEGRNDPEIKLLERTVAREYFDQEIAADFTSFRGKIFGEWDETLHVGDVEFDPALPNYIAFDWGFTNPLAAIEFQVTPSDEIRIWREHYRSYTILEDHIRLLKTRPNPPGYHLDMAFGDAADPEAVEVISRYLVGCWADPDAKVNWRAGIDLIKKFLKPHDTGLVDEFDAPIYRTHFKVDFNCNNFRREMNNYKAPDGVKERNAREIGNQKEDHGIDAIRYALMMLFELGAKHHLAETFEEPRTREVVGPDYMADPKRLMRPEFSTVAENPTFFSLAGQEF